MVVEQPKRIRCHITPCKAIKIFSLKHQQDINIHFMTRFHHTIPTIKCSNLEAHSTDFPMSSLIIQCRLISPFKFRILDYFNRLIFDQTSYPSFIKHRLCMQPVFESFWNLKFFQGFETFCLCLVWKSYWTNLCRFWWESIVEWADRAWLGSRKKQTPVRFYWNGQRR